MGHDDLLDRLVEENNEMLVMSKATGLGVPKSTIYNYIRRRKLERLATGVYGTDECWLDGLYILHLRCPSAVFSHDASLYFHDLTDHNPYPCTVTVKQGYNSKRLPRSGVQVFYVKEELLGIGRTTAVDPFGNTLPIYDVERTICDIVRSRSRMDPDVLVQALKRYALRRDKNLPRLDGYARIFHMEKLLRTYLEVLL